MQLHSYENNKESQSHLEENDAKFTGQCKKVWDLLRSGVRLTVRDAMIKYGISSLPRRLADLRKNGYYCNEEWLTDASGKKTVKQWFLPEDQLIPKPELPSHAKKMWKTTEKVNQFLKDIRQGNLF